MTIGRWIARATPLALVVALALSPAVAGPPGPARPDGPALSLADPDHTLRRSVDPAVVARLHGRLEREPLRGRVWTETLFRTLAAVASEIDALEMQGQLDGDTRREIGALSVLLAVDEIVDAHPELEPTVTYALASVGPSPIERICMCDKRGSIACGCHVSSTGPGECEYRVQCPSYMKAGCSVVNFEMCISETVIDIISPLR